MNKLKYFLTAVALLVLIFVTFNSADNNLGRTIKIGVAVPITGSNGFVGESIRDVINMVLNERKDTKYKYEVIFEDTQPNPQSAVTAANKLITVDKVDVIIDAYAPIGVAIAPIAEKNKILHIGISFNPSAAEGKYNFIHFTTPETAVRALLTELKTKNINKIGVFHQINPGILSVNTELVRLSSEYGIKILSNQEFQPGEKDFRGLITTSQIHKNDYVVLLSIAPDIDILAKQLQELGYKNLTSTIYFELSPNKKIYEGLWSIGSGSVSLDFQNKFKEIYDKEPVFATANSYDIMEIIIKLAEGYTGHGKPSPEYLADTLQHLENYEGVLGKLTVDNNGIIDSPVMIKIIKDGVLVPVE